MNFRTWKENLNKLLGFLNRRVTLDRQAKFKYIPMGVYGYTHWGLPIDTTACHYNMILGGLSFFHRFYLYVSTIWNYSAFSYWELLLNSCKILYPPKKNIPVLNDSTGSSAPKLKTLCQRTPNNRVT